MKRLDLFRLLLSGAIVCILLHGSGIEAAAQRLSEGSRIRVFQEDHAPRSGVLRRLSADTLWYRADDSETTTALSLASVERLDVRERVSRTRGAWRWAKWSFLGGAAVGGVSCLVDPEPCKSAPDDGTAATALESAFFVGSGIALLGAVGGALFPGYRWRTLSSPYEMTLAPGSLPGPSIRFVIRR